MSFSRASREVLLSNAHVHTLAETAPATHIAIRDGRVLAVGDASVRALLGPSPETHDLAGACVFPGFIDAHIHWQWTSLNYSRVRLEYVATRRECIERVAAAARTAKAGEWIIGFGWAQGDWRDTPNQFPTAADLDAVAPNNPVFLSARSGHATWANSPAMKIAGITDGTPDPPMGVVGRDEKGHPTGVFFEEASRLVGDHVPPPTAHDVANAMEAAQHHAWRAGLTGIHDFDRAIAFEAFQLLRDRGTLGLRVLKNINDPIIHHAHELGLRSGFGDEWLRIGGLKIFADGALGAVTALMIEPYDGQPDNVGVRVTPKDEMRALVLEGTRRGFPATIHAIGDLAVRDVLDVLADARKEEARLGIPRNARRHRIEHVQLVHPDDIGRLAELDIIASIQPIHATADIDMADRYWGARARLAYNAREQLNRGVTVAFGSDSPVEPFNPLLGIHAAATRRRADGSPGPEGWYPEARVTVDEAIRAYALGPAFAAGLEEIQGHLSPGALADLVVLESDPATIDPHAIKDIQVLGTMVGGEWKYRV
jgi:predicted amidohydrolase YtcJ